MSTGTKKAGTISKSSDERRSAHPVNAVREYAMQLEAAMAVALAQPKKPAVHRLRVQTRRLEAQLLLLQHLSALPAEDEPAKQLTGRLRKLRKAAGRVRDLDVQGDLLEAQLDLPREAAGHLREKLGEARERRAAKLRRMLFHQLPKIAGALEQMVQSLATANGLVVPEVRLVAMIEQWKAAQWKAAQLESAQAEPALKAESLDDEQLHDLRKTAKAARYMAESAAGSAAARQAAARYEAQQDAGGVWHDWVDLAETAKDFFGKKHELTVAAAAKRDEARAVYLKLLQ